MIDQAHHMNQALRALQETLELEAGLEAALSEVDLNETLVMVTADHSHTLNINGYPGRGDPLSGYTGPKDAEGKNYSILSYGNGPGAFEASSGVRSMESRFPAVEP